jgi:hypothetical protein
LAGAGAAHIYQESTRFDLSVDDPDLSAYIDAQLENDGSDLIELLISGPEGLLFHEPEPTAVAAKPAHPVKAERSSAATNGPAKRVLFAEDEPTARQEPPQLNGPQRRLCATAKTWAGTANALDVQAAVDQRYNLAIKFMEQKEAQPRRSYVTFAKA